MLVSGEIKAVYERIDESVFSYCVYSSGALCLPDAEDESDGNETRASAMNFCLFVPLHSESLLKCMRQIKLAALELYIDSKCADRGRRIDLEYSDGKNKPWNMLTLSSCTKTHTHTYIPECIAGTVLAVCDGSPSLPHRKCVFAIRWNTQRKEEFMSVFI